MNRISYKNIHDNFYAVRLFSDKWETVRTMLKKDINGSVIAEANKLQAVYSGS